MPIVTPEAPKQSIEALGGTLASLATSAGLKRAAPNFAARIAASPSELRTPGLSYRVYVLGLADMLDAKDLTPAKLSAWRHEFAVKDEVVAIDVTTGRQPQFSSLNVSPVAHSVQRHLDSAAFEASNFGPQSYDVALLRVPALAVRAVWLKSRSRSHEDIIVPLAPPMPSELTAHQRYTATEFIDALRPAARRVLAAEAPGKGG
ncbi:hypothetical protein [Mycobacterium sp.]|uniref:hypothetical protein n=1 Tax=Mycobacterium sp. TaxID=1785 RepID=UPI002D8021ED|nr:hypothetical protein [Mycobacterium sp.]